jgi:HAE1 family hydrophobic/amphiphilic exporter-1
MPIVSQSIKRPVAVTMFYIAAALLGIYAFSRIGVDLLPNISIPHLIVQTNYPNSTPEEVEKLVTEPLESAAGTVTGVKKITSVSKEGISVLSIDFVWGTDMDYALLALREKLDNISFMLPREAGRPSIIRVDPSSTPIMTLVLSYKEIDNEIKFANYNTDEADIKRLTDLKEAARVIFQRRLEQIDGVAQAIITGGLEREVLVEVNPKILNAYNLTYSDIAFALKSSNVNLPAGSIMKGLFRYSFRTLGEYQNLDEIRKTILRRNKDGSVILLEDIAAVRESFKERNGLTRYNGTETIGILINKEPQSNTVDIAQRVRNAVAVMQKEYPEYNLAIVSDHSKFIVNAIENVKQEIFYGGILAFIVLFFFLGNIRNILIIGITIPSSLVLTMLLMYLFKINFNIISLGGIAVGVGMLLDNAIVVIENISRYKELDYNNPAAALKGANEVSMPIVAATLTTIAVFLPLIFISGIAGELFKDQSYAVAFSLSASIITAITLIPMLASKEKLKIVKDTKELERKYLSFNIASKKKLIKRFLSFIALPFIIIFRVLIFAINYLVSKIGFMFNTVFRKFFPHVDNYMEKIIDKYDKLLLWSLNNRLRVMSLTLILIAITLFALFDIKKEFIPEAPEEEFIIEIVYPKGTSLEGNAAITSQIEAMVLDVPGVVNAISNIGRVNEFDFLNREQISVDKTNLIVKIDSYEKYYNVQERLRQIFQNTKGLKYSFKKVENTFTQILNPSKNDIVIKIKNKNIDQAFEKGEILLDKIKEKNIAGLSELRLGIDKGDPEYRITIDREKCIAYGISVENVSNQIVNLVKGKEAAYFSDFDKKIAINIKSTEPERNRIDKIISNYVSGGRLGDFGQVNKQTGNPVRSKVPISDVINYELTESYNEIWREGQSRVVYLFASLNGSSIDKVSAEIEEVVNSLDKYQGENITVSGVNEEISSSLNVLYIVLLISVLLMYIVLASEFESFLFPFIIIFSVPLGLIGSIIILYLAGESLNIISVMGLIILVGIADNDAVVKVEFILRKRKGGMPLREAILAAGRERFRPIVMNTFTVVFALIPMMIGIGAATQLRVSLSIAIAGGLLSSTFLTLIIIPVLYTYMEKYSKKFK